MNSAKSASSKFAAQNAYKLRIAMSGFLAATCVTTSDMQRLWDLHNDLGTLSAMIAVA
jgi:hypothetical protein